MADQDAALSKALRGLGGLHSLNAKKARAAASSEGDSTRNAGPAEPVVENLGHQVDPVMADVPPVAPRGPKRRKTVEEQIREAAEERARVAGTGEPSVRRGPAARVGTETWVPHYEEALLGVASPEDWLRVKNMGYDDLAQSAIASWGKVCLITFLYFSSSSCPRILFVFNCSCALLSVQRGYRRVPPCHRLGEKGGSPGADGARPGGGGRA